MTAHTQRRVRCTLCDNAVTLNNFSAHLDRYHPDRPNLQRRMFYRELGETLPAVVTLVVPVAVEPEVPPLGAEDVDDIVLAVVQQLADTEGNIAVTHLPAIFAWRAATSVFLRKVTS